MAKSRYRAICKTACFWMKQYWPVGKEYRGMRKPCSHFNILEPKPKFNDDDDKDEEMDDTEVDSDDDTGSNESSTATIGGSPNSNNRRSNAGGKDD